MLPLGELVSLPQRSLTICDDIQDDVDLSKRQVGMIALEFSTLLQYKMVNEIFTCNPLLNFPLCIRPY